MQLFGAKARHYFSIEFRVGLPGLRRNHSSMPHRLPIGIEFSAARFDIGATVLIRRNLRAGN